jgi:hypothetical protein
VCFSFVASPAVVALAAEHTAVRDGRESDERMDGMRIFETITDV